MSDDSLRRIERMIDVGGRFLFPNDWCEEEQAEGVLLDMSACANPECLCQEVTIAGRFMQLTEAGEWVRGTRPDFFVDFDLTTKELTICEASEADAIPEWVERGLTGEWYENIRERRNRFRGQQNREAWRDLPRQELEEMSDGLLIDHCTMFPDDWDMVLDVEDRTYWVCDSYCLNPACSCQTILVGFTDLDAGKDIGRLRVGLGDWQHPEIEDGADTTRLWKAFIAGKGRKQQIRKRFREMKRVAAALPEVLGWQEAAPAQTPMQVPAEPDRKRSGDLGRKIGRNEPCPCGSGRKYKRCCGSPR